MPHVRVDLVSDRGRGRGRVGGRMEWEGCEPLISPEGSDSHLIQWRRKKAVHGRLIAEERARLGSGVCGSSFTDHSRRWPVPS